jgi:hypothetical protein
MENGMTDEQADKIIAAIEALTLCIERVSRPPVIVTNDPYSQAVVSYQRRGYPICWQMETAEELERRDRVRRSPDPLSEMFKKAPA